MQFAWSCFLYGGIGGDQDYQHIMKNTALLQQLRQAPQSISNRDFQDKVISRFLNKWKCRTPNNPRAASIIKNQLIQLHPYVQAISKLTIRDSFASSVTVPSHGQQTLGQIIDHSYSTLKGCTNRFGPTATSKLLHVLLPEVFVMWDGPIIDNYRKIDKTISESSRGYHCFHERMRNLILNVDQSFASSQSNPIASAGQSFDNYLSTQLKYTPAKPAAKFVDEFNWITITKNVSVPPNWHPEK